MKEKETVDPLPSLNLLGHRDCTACHLSKTRTNVVPGNGTDPAQATLVLVGEAPGADEDREGVPFVGKAGQLLRGIMFDGMGLDQRRVFFTNTYMCRPPANKIALAKGSPCPSIWLTGELQNLPSKQVIVALGRTALSFFRPTTGNEPVSVLAARDTRWPDPEFGPLWVVGAYHPSAVLRAGVERGSREGNVKLVSLVASIQRAMYYMEGLPYYAED